MTIKISTLLTTPPGTLNNLIDVNVDSAIPGDTLIFDGITWIRNSGNLLPSYDYELITLTPDILIDYGNVMNIPDSNPIDFS